MMIVMMMKRRKKKRKKKANIIKEEDLLDLLPQFLEKEICLIYIGDMEELLQDLKEEGDMSHLDSEGEEIKVIISKIFI